MANIQDLTYSVGGRTLYEGASLQIKADDKIGLVGLNGTGKTTLFRLLTGELKPESGRVQRGGQESVRLLSQDMLSIDSEESIRAVALQAFQSVLAIQARIDQLLEKMQTDYDEETLHKLALLQEQLAQMGGYSITSEAEKMLEGMGFQTADLDRPLSSFSGGWRMRVMLAKLLLEKPDLLLLDEPTNHLDIDSIQWVEQYLQSYDKAYIVISHDRRFLDNVTRKTVWIEHKKLQVFPGNYTFAEQAKEEQAEIQHSAYVNQQKKIQQVERFIERFRAKASKASQAQSKIKELDRMERVEAVRGAAPAMHVKFPMEKQPGQHVLTFANVDKVYADHIILMGAKGVVERGDKIALVGPNGKGKSTLLHILAERIPPDNGIVQKGHQVKVACYAQHQLEDLVLTHTILEELRLAAPTWPEQDIRKLLGAFLFVKNDVHKLISVLSGGEKARVALAKLLAQGANLLLLDEPTNHLDLISIDLLSQALQQYEGAVVVVSHNRHFLAQIANKVWYLEEGEVKEFPGPYEEYVYWKAHNKEGKTGTAGKRKGASRKE